MATNRKSKSTKVQEAILHAASSVGADLQAGKILATWDYKAAGYKSMEHGVAVILGALTGAEEVVPNANDLKGLRVKETINGIRPTVGAVTRAVYRCIRAAKPKEQTEAKEFGLSNIKNRVKALVEKSAEAGLEVSAITVMQNGIKQLKDRLAKAEDHGHDNADKEPADERAAETTMKGPQALKDAA